jgi:hypothetical protein
MLEKIKLFSDAEEELRLRVDKMAILSPIGFNPLLPKQFQAFNANNETTTNLVTIPKQQIKDEIPDNVVINVRKMCNTFMPDINSNKITNDPLQEVKFRKKIKIEKHLEPEFLKPEQLKPDQWVPDYSKPEHWDPQHWVSEQAEPKHSKPDHWVPDYSKPEHWDPEHWVPEQPEPVKSGIVIEEQVPSVSMLAKRFSGVDQDQIQVQKIEPRKINKLPNEEEEEKMVPEKKPLQKSRSADDVDSQKDREEIQMETKIRRNKFNLQEHSKTELKLIANQLFTSNKTFLEQCGVDVERKKPMFSDCNLGSSSYRDWQLPEVRVEEVLDDLDLSPFIQSRKKLKPKSVFVEREVLSDKTNSDHFQHLKQENLIQCPKRVLPPRNSKSKVVKSGTEKSGIVKTGFEKSGIVRAKSVEAEMGKWDSFLKEIGRLSIEIDDENETFI